VSKEQVLIVGSLAFDDLEMPSGYFKDVLGGAATYSSLSASFLAGVRVVGVVGADFGEPILADFRKRGIDTEGVERAAGRSFRWRGRYAPDLSSRTTLDTQLNVFADFKPKIPAAYKRTPYLLLGNIHPALQISVLDQMDRPKLVAADTMNLWIDTEPKLLGDMLSRIDLLIINDEEARQLSGIQNIRKAAADIRKRGPSRLIIKRGEFGALLFDNGGVFFVPAYPLEQVLDPTGAGDTFAGGLMGYLARHDDASTHALRRAMFFGSALASFCVEEVGTKRLAGLEHADLAKRIHEFAQMVDHGGGLHFSE
jgi:sugar/nucleoside kinase (ribokinase family)